ncbi:MAG: hypothetical protein AB7P20_17365 [Rhizobiaceae bacterium]
MSGCSGHIRRAIDLAMTEEPENLMLKLLREMRAEIGNVRSDVGKLDKKIDETRDELQSEMRSLRADVASDMIVNRKETSEQIAGLRRAVVEYHTSVIGHGILISEREARARRCGQHLNLPSIDVN